MKDQLGTMGRRLHRSGDRMERLGDRMVGAVEDAGGMVADTYRILDSEYSDELQPLIRFIGNSPVSFLLVGLLVTSLSVALFVAFDTFKFVIYSVFLGVGMALWYGTFVHAVGPLDAGLLGLVVCLLVAEELMVFLYHLSRAEKVAIPMARQRRRLAWFFLPYLKLTGRRGFIAAMTAFTFSAGMLGPVMAYLFSMRRRDARIAVFAGFILQAMFWTALYIFLIPAFPHPLVVTAAVFSGTGLVVLAPELVYWWRRRRNPR